MRIVQVVHGLPPQNMTGTELLTLELSRALQARGHQVTVIARTAAPEAAEFSVQYEQDIAPGIGLPDKIPDKILHPTRPTGASTLSAS